MTTEIDPELLLSGVDAVIHGRHSIRAYKAQEVPRTLLEELLNTAARAPSGTNIQPWRVHVLKGSAKQCLVQEVCAAFDAADPSHIPEYPYYPAKFFDPYLARRRKLGWDLYSLLGINKGDGERMRTQHRRNFEFFGAPVGLIFSIDRRLSLGSWLDYGMFLQNVMLAARARGLDTCPQAAWIDYHRIIGKQLGFGEHEQLVCGMALGYADWAAPENSLVTERAVLEEFVVFHG